MSATRLPPLVGREEEHAAMLARLERAGAGEGGVMLLAGEPGIGKTRLLDELIGHAHARQWRVLAGRAYQSEGLPPYLPVVEALRDCIRALTPEQRRAALGRGAGDLARLAPSVFEEIGVAPADTALSPEHERYRVFEAVMDFLRTLAVGATARNPEHVVNVRPGAAMAHDPPPGDERRPSEATARGGVLLIVDDLHWADTPTLLLFQHIARRVRDAPVLLVGTYRTVDLGRTHPLVGVLAELRRERLAERLLLAPLAETETRTLVEALAGRATPGIIRAIHRETDGNPFFIEEMVRHLQREGHDFDDASQTGAWGIPEGVREVIGARLSHLSHATNHLLAVASVLGDGFEPDIVGAVAELESAQLVTALEEAVQAGILREEAGAYQFAHALIRQTAYGELSLPRRQGLHRSTVDAIERLRPGRTQRYVEALAGHARLAGVALDSSRTVRYATDAATAAMRVFAWEDAASHWQDVIELMPSVATSARCEALLFLAECRRRGGDQAGADSALEDATAIARSIGANELLARVALDFGLGGEVGGVNDDRVLALLEEALQAIGSEDSILRARVLARLAWQQLSIDRLAQRREYSAEAVAVARRLNHPATLAEALAARHWGLSGPDSLHEQLAVSDEIVRIGLRLGDSEITLTGRLWRISDLLYFGDIPAIDREIDAYERLAERLRQPYFAWYSHVFRAMRAMFVGRLDEAEQQWSHVAEVGSRGQQVLSAMYAGLGQALVASCRGQPRAAVTHVQSVGEPMDVIPGARAALAWWKAEAGDEESARALLAAFAGDGFAALPRDEDWLGGMAFLAMAAVALEQREYATTLYAMLLPYADLCLTIGNAAASLGSAHLYLARLAALTGLRDLALTHITAAIATNMRIGARVWLVESLVEHAAILLDDGSDDDALRAAELLAKAEAAAGSIGMGGTLRRIATLRRRAEVIGALGLSKRTPRSLPDGLTDREAEVLCLVAAGYTNRYIADTLVLSVRTVERHIAHVYAKTGARGRADATRYAVHHGLIPVTSLA